MIAYFPLALAALLMLGLLELTGRRRHNTLNSTKGTRRNTMNVNRRQLFKLAAAAGAGAALPVGADGQRRPQPAVPGRPRGPRRHDELRRLPLLRDGLRRGQQARRARRRTTTSRRSGRRAPDQFTVVNQGTTKSAAGEDRFAKTQCMHCVEPACASGCVVRALEKTKNGPVIYHADRCLGCRYCMIACPFGVPKYQFTKAVPIVRKCTFCAERQAEGKPPACAEACPNGALHVREARAS